MEGVERKGLKGFVVKCLQLIEQKQLKTIIFIANFITYLFGKPFVENYACFGRFPLKKLYTQKQLNIFLLISTEEY